MRLIYLLSVGALLAVGSSTTPLRAQDAGAVQKRLNDEFTLTKTTDDRSDIVTAGSVLVLHKDGLLMYSTPTSTAPLNTYKDGRIQHSSAGNYLRVAGGNLFHHGDSSDALNTPHRNFVTGEKFWVTAITMQQDGVVFNVYSDPFNDVRYYGQLKFPFPKNAVPPADTLVKVVEEVVTVQPNDDEKAGGGKRDAAPPQSGSASAPANEQSASMAPIAPPPPPPDQPPPPAKTISVGQTQEAVIAEWGQPTKKVKLASKEIYYYPDMKVIFVAGKVSDVQ